MVNNRHLLTFLGFIVFAILIAIPLFVDLDTKCLRVWDEGRLAMNALEMSESGNLLVTTFHGKPDHWNLKPPLMIWLQAGAIKLIGPTELAIRLPSAIAAFTLCMFLLWFSNNYFNSVWAGAIAGLVLVTSSGFTGHHTSRTGDYDTLLTLFLTIANLIFFNYIRKTESRRLSVFFLAMTLAFLTKSMAALLFVPSLFLYALFNKKVLVLVRSKAFYVGIGIFIVASTGYFIIREVLDPGYLSAVWQLDAGGRLVNTENSKLTDFWFYLEHINYKGFLIWNSFFPVCVIIVLLIGTPKTKRLLLFCLLLIVGHFLIISSAQTRLHWYSQPIFPFLALVVALGVTSIAEKLQQIELPYFQRALRVLWLPTLFLIFYTPYRWTLKRTVNPKEHSYDEQLYSLTNYLRSAVRNEVDLNGYMVVNPGYQAHNDFYMALLKKKHVDVKYGSVDNLQSSDKILVNDDEVKATVSANFHADEIDLGEGLSEFVIRGKKQL